MLSEDSSRVDPLSAASVWQDLDPLEDAAESSIETNNSLAPTQAAVRTANALVTELKFGAVLPTGQSRCTPKALIQWLTFLK